MRREEDGPEYVPGARIVFTVDRLDGHDDEHYPGEVRRAWWDDGEGAWLYYLALDNGHATTCSAAMLSTGTLPAVTS